MSEFRRDPLTGKWVIIAPDRYRRPYDYNGESGCSTAIPAERKCPFCRGNESQTPPASLTLPPGDAWQVRVVPNRFPAFEEAASDTNYRKDKQSLSMPPIAQESSFEKRAAMGIHEVLIESPEHDLDLPGYSLTQIELITSAIIERCRDYRSRDWCDTIFIFRNWGRRAGASLIHGHLQLGCLPLVSETISREFQFAKNAYIEWGCAMCSMLEAELAADTRIVAANDNFVALCPFAGKVPFQSSIVPRRHMPLFDEMTEAEIKDFAQITGQTLACLNTATGNADYNMMWKLPPIKADLREAWHWSVEIRPRTTIAAGFEFLSGIYINVVSPEDAASKMRALLPEGDLTKA
jgi:UDPglucose--hexose-1-phosphate uridylyltransferase